MSLSTSQPTTAGIVTAQNGDRLIPESTRADGSTRKAIRIRPGFRPAEDIERYRCRGAQNRAQARVAGPPGSQPAVEEKKSTPAPAPRSEAPATGQSMPTTAPVSPAPISRSSAHNEPLANPRTATYTPSNSRQSVRNNTSSSTSSTKSPAYLMSSWRRGPAESAPSEPPAQRAETSSKQAKVLISKALAPNNPPASPAVPASEEKTDNVVDAEAEREKKARGLKKKLKQARDLQAKKGEGKMLLPEQMAKVIKIDELVRELGLLGFGPEDDHKEESKSVEVKDTSTADELEASSKTG